MASRNLREYNVEGNGPKREKDPVKIARWDVVITTYDTVSSEFFGPKGSTEEVVFFSSILIEDFMDKICEATGQTRGELERELERLDIKDEAEPECLCSASDELSHVKEGCGGGDRSTRIRSFNVGPLGVRRLPLCSLAKPCYLQSTGHSKRDYFRCPLSYATFDNRMQ